MPRGGARTGATGKGYVNRTDLNTNRGGPLPIKTAPGQPYGAQAAQKQSMQVVPIATPQAPGSSAAPSGGGSSPGPAPAGAPPTPAPAGAPPMPPQPAPGGSLFASPPEGHPVTSGLPFGPGPGPESLPSAVAAATPTFNPLLSATTTLNQLGSQASPLVRAVTAQMNVLSQIAPQ